MRNLFSPVQMDQINAIAARSKEVLKPIKVSKSVTSSQHEIDKSTKEVLEYFKDSPAILITTAEDLHDYVLKAIASGYCAIDTETTGLDRIHDTIVGFSMYYPGGTECYIPYKHIVPIFGNLYPNQLTYEEIFKELILFTEAHTKLIFANADFDLAMMYKDFGIDLIPCCYYDVILAWRCLKEDEKDNTLKTLYWKYPNKQQGSPKKFRDFFSPELFPYSDPNVAKLYAANDAKITYELFIWQLPYVTKSNPKCQKHHLEKIADLFWNIEMPMVNVCAQMHRTGVYFDRSINHTLKVRYDNKYAEEVSKLSDIIQGILSEADALTISKSPFKDGKSFNVDSPKHVKYLLNQLLHCNVESGDKETLKNLNLPVTNQILAVRALGKLLNSFIDKLPRTVAKDDRIHGTFKSIGADCIIGDSIIPTDKGYRTIKEVCESYSCKEAEYVSAPGLVIANKDQSSESAASVIMYTDYPTIKIITEMGFTIEGTYNHPVMVSKYTAANNVYGSDTRLSQFWDERYFKQLEDIQIGDFVEIPCNYNIGPNSNVATDFVLYPPYNTSKVVAKLPNCYDENFAEFLGMYHADGSAYMREGTYTIAVSNDDNDVVSRIDYLSSLLFNVPTSHYTAQKENHEVETYINCMQIQDIDKVLSHGKQNKKIPEAIWKSPRSVINSYIKGLTLDSSVYLDENGRAALELSIINELDARFVQCHLASQGILCYMSYNENRGGWKTPRLVFNADNYVLFRDIIGFVQSCKYFDTKPCNRNKYTSRRIGDSFRVKVKSIEYHTNTVYDLHVPDTHSFISNGLISHNTGRMSSADPNMQQIPSHAIDIRHQFRATPAMNKIVDVSCIEDIVQVTLSRWCSVTTRSGQVDVEDLKPGDDVKLLQDNQPIWREIKAISISEKDDSCCDITFNTECGVVYV